MAIYEVTQEKLVQLDSTTFEQAQIKERADLQRLIRDQVHIISPDTLVISEEFSDWEDSRRRIDLLGVDKDANLVVIELKRTEDGGHMELQALRYAAMVSAMGFDDVIRIYGEFLRKHGITSDPDQELLDFLGWESSDDGAFATEVRIVLASAEFSKELTTAVMWLNQHDLDVKCVRLKPYQHEGRVFVDVQQIIPLPEAADYQVKIREKQRQDREERAERFDLRREFWTELLSRARGQTTLHANSSPGEYHWIGASAGRRGFLYSYVIRKHEGSVELYIDLGDVEQNKAFFDSLLAKRDEIEASFGAPLTWQRLDNRRACRIKHTIAGGYRDTPDIVTKVQDEMIASMVRLDKTLRPLIAGDRPSNGATGDNAD